MAAAANISRPNFPPLVVDGKPELSGAQLRDVTALWVASDESDREKATDLTVRLNTQLNHAGPYCHVEVSREHKRRAKLAQAERNRAMGLIPRDKAPMTRANVADIRKAERLVAIAAAVKVRRDKGLKITRAEREEAHHGLIEARAILVGVEVDLTDRTDERYIARVKAEITTLEQDYREETVVTETLVTSCWEGSGRDRHIVDREVKRLRITTRDGLEALHFKTPAERARGDLPAITKLQFDAGMRARELYEKIDPERSLKPAAIDPDARGGSHHGGEGWEDKRAEISLQFSRLVVAVRIEGERRAAGRKGGAETGALWIRVLVEVVCKGSNIRTVIREANEGSRARERWKNAVAPVLDVVADHLGMH